jgi:hypothetical protein
VHALQDGSERAGSFRSPRPVGLVTSLHPFVRSSADWVEPLSRRGVPQYGGYVT